MRFASVSARPRYVARADHVAVALFVEKNARSLTLHLPCPFVGGAFEERADAADWRTNPGKSANYYHRRFSQAMGSDTLQEIEGASQIGATLNASYRGFHARNTAVAKSQFLLAFTWGTSDAPADGGTLDTWKKCSSTKLHVPLQSLVTEATTSATAATSGSR